MLVTEPLGEMSPVLLRVCRSGEEQAEKDKRYWYTPVP